MMRGDREAFVRQLGWLDFTLAIDQHVEDLIAPLTDKMLMPFDQRIEMLRAADHQDLQLVVGD